MCGIAGIITPASTKRRASLERMLSALRHRGPDSSGIAEFSECILGHTRLSIIDLEGGKQPLTNKVADKNISITFNGEIYGYQSLKKRFPNFPFTTESDTEVILAAYLEHGTEMLDYLPGMFSFAIWDDNKKSLFCARDRFGEKPFYFTVAPDGSFVFGSELNSVLASGKLSPTISKSSLTHYLQRLNVPNNQSIYEEIQILPPGHFLIFHKGQLTVKPYWQLPLPGPPLSLSDAAEELERLLRISVQKQLVSDVPVGVFLSGGLDSTTITHHASQINPSITSYSYEFPGSYSEKRFARDAANKYNTNHIELTSHDLNLVRDIPKALGAYGEPFADSSAIPTYFLCQQAAMHTKVVLTGDGADELFGGYGWYKPLYWMDSFAKTNFIKKLLLRVISRGARICNLSDARFHEERNLGSLYGHRFQSVLDAHNAQLKWFSDDLISQLGLSQYENTSPIQQTGSLDDALRQDLVDYMPGDILTKIDRASMAHSLELRSPFLDRDLAEFCVRLPVGLKLSDSEDKIVLRKAYKDVWPPSIKERQKQGFGSPINEWLNKPSMSDMVNDLVWSNQSPLLDILDMSSLQADKYRSNPNFQWPLLCLAIWMNSVEKLDYPRYRGHFEASQ